MGEVAVIGAGSWGTAIARVLGSKGVSVRLWAHSPQMCEELNEAHRNPRFLTDVELPNVWCSSDMGHIVSVAESVVFVCPSSHLRETCEKAASYIADDTPCIVLSKGVEGDTGFTMIQVVEDVIGNEKRLAALSGPNHAEEISHDMYAATVVASSDETCAEYFQELFSTPTFRVYTSNDTIGVEICAAAKNVIAIANGMSVAMNMGDNASATLITRGLAEITRLVDALGGDARTCTGLAGMGDLFVTCTSVHSRNRRLGEMLVAGGTLEQFQRETGMVAEGAVACRTVTDAARRAGVEMPIAELVRKVLWEGMKPQDCAEALFDRPNRPELDD